MVHQRIVGEFCGLCQARLLPLKRLGVKQARFAEDCQHQNNHHRPEQQQSGAEILYKTEDRLGTTGNASSLCRRPAEFQPDEAKTDQRHQHDVGGHRGPVGRIGAAQVCRRHRRHEGQNATRCRAGAEDAKQDGKRRYRHAAPALQPLTQQQPCGACVDGGSREGENRRAVVAVRLDQAPIPER